MINKDGTRNASLLFIDDSECDMCNKENVCCAHIDDLLGNVSIICHQCLKNIVDVIEAMEKEV